MTRTVIADGNFHVKSLITLILQRCTTPQKLNGQSEELRQKWKRPKSFDICFSVSLTAQKMNFPFRIFT